MPPFTPVAGKPLLVPRNSKEPRPDLRKQLLQTMLPSFSRTPGRPTLESKYLSCLPLEINENPSVPQRLSRTLTAAYNKELCFFCQTDDEKRSVHAIQTESRGKQLHDFVKNCDNDLYKVYLSSAIKPDDALSIDVQYHRTCWTKHVVRTTDNFPQLESTVEKENEIAANIEFLNLIEHENKTMKIQGSSRV